MEKPRTIREARDRAALALVELARIGGEELRPLLIKVSKQIGSKLNKQTHEYLDTFQPPRRDDKPIQELQGLDGAGNEESASAQGKR